MNSPAKPFEDRIAEVVGAYAKDREAKQYPGQSLRYAVCALCGFIGFEGPELPGKDGPGLLTRLIFPCPRCLKVKKKNAELYEWINGAFAVFALRQRSGDAEHAGQPGLWLPPQ